MSSIFYYLWPRKQIKLRMREREKRKKLKICHRMPRVHVVNAKNKEFIWPLDLSVGSLSDIVSFSGCSHSKHKFIIIHAIESLLPLFFSYINFKIANANELFVEHKKRRAKHGKSSSATTTRQHSSVFVQV